MKKITISFIVCLTFIISGCLGTIEDNSNGAVGEFQSDVNLNASFYTTGADSLVIQNNSAKVGQIVLIDNGRMTKAKRIESLSGKNAVVSDAEIEEVFNDLVIQNQYPINDAEQVNQAPANSRASVNILSRIEQINVENGIIFKLDDYPLLDKKGFKIEVGGQVFLEKPEIDVDYNLVQKTAMLSAHFGESSEVHIKANTPGVNFFYEKELLLGHYIAPVQVLGYPICQISYALILQVGVFGEMNILARIDQVIAADVSLDVSTNGIVPAYNFYPPSGEYFSYIVQGTGHFEAWVNLLPQVGLQILQYNVAILDGSLGASAQANLNVIAVPGVKDGTFDLNCEAHAFLWATLLQNKELTYDILNWSKEFTYAVDFLD